MTSASSLEQLVPTRTSSPLKVSVLMPTYNEAENIVPLIDAIYAQVPDVHELIVVDDNSPDGTAALVEAHAKKLPAGVVRIEKRTRDRGLTKSLKQGIKEATGNVVVWLDCDFSMPPEVIPQLLSCIQQGYDVAVGSRFVRGGRFKENTQGTPDSALAVFLSRVMNYSIQLLLVHSFKDYTSGFIAVRKEVLDAVPLEGNYGEYFIGLMFRAIRKGYRVIELPYVCVPRQRGESKTGQNLGQYLRLGSRYVTTALGLRWEALKKRALPLKPFYATEPLKAGESISITPMSADHVPLVSGLHHQVLDQTFNSRLGIPFLEDLYGSLLSDPATKAWVAVKEGEILGFVCATQDVAKTERHIQRSVYWRNQVVALLHVLTQPRDLRDFLSHKSLMRYVRRFGQPYPTILTFGVAPRAQGAGVASRLMNEVLSSFKHAKIAKLYVDTLQDNSRALAFYQKKMGFERIGQSGPNVVLAKALKEEVRS